VSDISFEILIIDSMLCDPAASNVMDRKSFNSGKLIQVVSNEFYSVKDRYKAKRFSNSAFNIPLSNRFESLSYDLIKVEGECDKYIKNVDNHVADVKNTCILILNIEDVRLMSGIVITHTLVDSKFCKS